MVFDQLIARTLALDLETTRSGGRIRRIGAVFRGQAFEWAGSRVGQQALARLEAFGSGSEYVLGHNILTHDLPILKGLAPELKILDLPVIDTLFLSPLASPRNPYHRLVKDYKLVRACLSDPIEDVRLAWSDKLSLMVEIRILGMIRWSADDSREHYRHLARTPSWELPLMEVVTENITKPGSTSRGP